MGSNSKSSQTERTSKFYLHPATFSDMHLCYVGQLGVLKESTEQKMSFAFKPPKAHPRAQGGRAELLLLVLLFVLFFPVKNILLKFQP